MRKVCHIILAVSSIVIFNVFSIAGQNLISNASFEDIECPDNTIASFYETEYWNATGADAYWMHYSCPPDPIDIQSIIAINTGIIPYHGSGYVSLEGLIFKNGYCISEGVSQQLEKPMTKGSYYYLDLATLKYDVQNPFEEIPPECSSFPDRGLELRLDDQHIKIDYNSKTQNFQPLICGIETTSQLIVDDIHQVTKPSSGRSWNAYWTCFQVQDDYEYFSITGPNKLFEDFNECMEEGLEGFQHLTGYAIDYIQLYEIPQMLDTTLALCNGFAFFSIEDLVEGPFLDKASYKWDDGLVGSFRKFNEEGNYRLNVELPCTEISVNIVVEDEKCDINVFMPNIFSFRDKNNEVRPFLQSDVPIENYNWSIYDRWGNLIFSSDEMGVSWDGTNNGREVDEGVYMWKIDYVINNGSVKKEAIGSITLLK